MTKRQAAEAIVQYCISELMQNEYSFHIKISHKNSEGILLGLGIIGR